MIPTSIFFKRMPRLIAQLRCPLMTVNGVVVGVTSAIFSPSGGSVGLGFAIPAETVSAIVREIELHGRVERGYLGISAQAVTPLTAMALHLKTARALWLLVWKRRGQPMAPSSLETLLLKVESIPVSFKDLSKLSARLVPGSLASLAIFGREALSLLQ